MPYPFEIGHDDLVRHLDVHLDSVFGSLQSDFLLLPRGPHFVPYDDFQRAFEAIKRHTATFARFTPETVWSAMLDDSLAFVVLRTILGFSPPEWAELAQKDSGVEIPQGAVRQLDIQCRKSSTKTGRRDRFARMRPSQVTFRRAKALIATAVDCIVRGGDHKAEATVHRLAKVDTQTGLASLQHVASHQVPYAVLLYERYLGRPFASHRDSVLELVGEVMENAIERLLMGAGITFRKTALAERIPGFEQAPDFFVPDEFSPAVIVEAKITGDDGTARDKVSRILRLASIRDERERQGKAPFEVVACIDGRGFGVRRQDMKDMLVATRGKVFTLATLDRLVANTAISQFAPHPKQS